jgi:hypothetical protein
MEIPAKPFDAKLVDEPLAFGLGHDILPDCEISLYYTRV